MSSSINIGTNIKILNKPLLRWTGGKKWLIPYFDDLVKNIEFENYHEPFFGGGSIFFSLKNFNKAYLSDSNIELINCYKQVKENPKEVFDLLKKLPQNKESYYEIRDAKYDSKIKMACRFIYLNKTSFNGIYRVNSKGKYNVPFGNRKFNLDIIKKSIFSCSNQLKKARLNSGDFQDVIYKVKKNDLVYLDPPYTITHNNNGFIEYNEKLFSFSDQVRLSCLISEIREKNAYYVLSNAHHPDVKKIYDKFDDNVIELDRWSNISAKTESRENYKEFLFTNIKH